MELLKGKTPTDFRAPPKKGSPARLPKNNVPA